MLTVVTGTIWIMKTARSKLKRAWKHCFMVRDVPVPLPHKVSPHRPWAGSHWVGEADVALGAHECLQAPLLPPRRDWSAHRLHATTLRSCALLVTTTRGGCSVNRAVYQLPAWHWLAGQAAKNREDPVEPLGWWTPPHAGSFPGGMPPGT